jgi:hypothetical protein
MGAPEIPKRHFDKKQSVIKGTGTKNGKIPGAMCMMDKKETVLMDMKLVLYATRPTN